MGDRCFVTLKSVVRSIDDGDWIESKDQSSSGIRLLQVGNIGNGFYVEKGNNARYISENTFSKLKCKEVLEGDILISRLPAPIGRACLVPFSQEKRITAVDCTIVRLKESVCNKRYLLHFLRSPEYFCQIDSFVAGSTRKRISRKNLEQIQLPLPPLPIQQKIADALDKASALIEMRKAQIEKLDLLVKSQFIEMFGDPVTNPKGWETKTLKDICSKLTDGTHFSPESFQQGDFMYITAKNIKIGGFDLSNITYVNSKSHEEIYLRCNPEYGDVLYIKDGVTTGIAMVNYLSTPFTMLSSVALLKQDRSIATGEYLCGVLNNERKYISIRSYMGGAAITRLTIDKLNRIEIPVPPIHLQQQFSTFALDIMHKKRLLRDSLAIMESNYNSLVQKCFNGEMNLNE